MLSEQSLHHLNKAEKALGQLLSSSLMLSLMQKFYH